MKDAQPRTMQFLVERHCSSGYIPLPVELPLVVWVLVPNWESLMPCGGRTWRVTSEEINRFQAQFIQERPGNAVCEHMGHLIE